MDPSILIPLPDAIPVHYNFLNIFFISTFVLHILLVNVMLGTCIIALIKSITGKEQDIFQAKEVSLNLPYAIAFAVNMGVAPLLFIQVLYGSFIYTSSVLMGWYWLMIIPILIIAYYSAYLFDFKFDSLGSARNVVIFFCTLLLLFIAFLFVNNITLMLTPEKWTEYFTNPKGTILNLSEVTLIPRYLHFVFASLAVGGLSISILGKIKHGKDPDHYSPMIFSGMKWFFYGTLVQVFIGAWFLMSLPKNISSLFVGGNFFATFLLVAGLVFALIVLYSGFKEKVWTSSIMIFLLTIIMVLMRDIVRTAYLKPYFSLSDLKIEPQYSPLIFFLISIVIGISIIAYMLRLVATRKKEA